MPLPSTPDIIESAFANSGTASVTAPPQTDANGFVNFQDGYGPDYEIDLNSGNTAAKAVERPVQNYLFQLMTKIGMFWQQMGAPPWYASMAGGYNKGAVVGRVSGTNVWQRWRSLQDANVVDPNLSGQTAWEYIPLNTELLSEVAMPAGGVQDVPVGGQTTEIVQAAADFNTFTTGTWEFGSDAIANGSAHAPVQLGASGTFAGMLQAKSWTFGGSTFNVQVYSDRTGNLFVRGAQNGIWQSWRSITPVSNYSVDSSATVNVVQGNALLSSTALTDGQKFIVKAVLTNTGATTFSPNIGIAAQPLVGLSGNALQGGEIVAGSRIEVIYNAAANNWTLIYGTAAPLQVGTGTSGQHAATVAQAQNNSPWLGVDSGSANSFVVALTPALSARPDGLLIRFKAAASNTGPCIINDGVAGGTVPVIGAAHLPLQGGEVVAGGYATLEWNSTVQAGGAYVLLECTGGATQSAPAVNSNQTLNASQVYGYRNKIINGRFNVDQRQIYQSVPNTPNISYTVDRWRFNSTVVAKVTAQMQFNASNSLTAPASYIHLNSSLATAPAATDLYTLEQVIENVTLNDLLWGTANAKAVSLQFKIRASVAGNYAVSIYNGNSASPRSYVLSVNVPTANVWQQVTLNDIPGDTGGTWSDGFNGGTAQTFGFTLRFGLCIGSNFNGSPNVWGAANNAGFAGCANALAAVNQTLDITDVQLEAGSVCTPFEQIPYADEVKRCQRYFQPAIAGFSGQVVSGATYFAFCQLPTMRINPSILWKTNGGASNFSASVPTIGQAGINNNFPVGFYAGRVATATASTGDFYDTFTVDADFY